MNKTNPVHEAQRLLKHHSKGKSFEHTVNRLLGEQVGRGPGVKEAALKGKFEEWPLDQLLTLWRKHDRLKPRRTNEPIVMIEFEGTMRLLDGTNRINVWEQRGDIGPHPVIILSTV